jgi:hypothetical protein
MPYKMALIVNIKNHFKRSLVVSVVLLNGNDNKMRSIKKRPTCTNLSTLIISPHLNWGISFPGIVNSKKVNKKKIIAGIKL